MTREDELKLLSLHLAGQPTEEWGALLADGTLMLKPLTLKALGRGGKKELIWWREVRGHRRAKRMFEQGRELMIFSSPSDVRVGQPVLLKIRPHGDYCGCTPNYSAHTT